MHPSHYHRKIDPHNLCFFLGKKKGNRVLGAHRLRYVEPPLHLHAAIADAGAGGFKLAIADLPLKSNFFIPLYSKPQAPALHIHAAESAALLRTVRTHRVHPGPQRWSGHRLQSRRSKAVACSDAASSRSYGVDRRLHSGHASGGQVESAGHPPGRHHREGTGDLSLSLSVRVPDLAAGPPSTRMSAYGAQCSVRSMTDSE